MSASFMLFAVHVPAFSRRRRQRGGEGEDAADEGMQRIQQMLGGSAGDVTGSSQASVSQEVGSDAIFTEPESETLQQRLLFDVASTCREFIRASPRLCFVSEIPYMNGKVRWSFFMFTCKASFAEEYLGRLGNIGIGAKQDGIGIVNVIPVQMQRFATNPQPEGTAIMGLAKPASAMGTGLVTPPAPMCSKESVGTIPSRVLSNVVTAASLDGQTQPTRPDSPESQNLSTEKSSEVKPEVSNALRAAADAGLLPENDQRDLANGDVPGAPPAEIHPSKVEEAIPEENGAQEVSRVMGDDGRELGPEELENDLYAHESESEGSGEFTIEVENKKTKSAFDNLLGRFGETIKSRIAVDSAVELVKASAEFSFDYVMLVLVASMLSCIGLATNNVVVIVASMLVSPLMGPILGVTFGYTLGETELTKMGLFSELVGLGICASVGFVGGLFAALAIGDQWPTQEMWIRASPSSVYIGIAIAIPSGIGVALSVLGNNTSSLVGVAISASLLPPAVNTGMLLAMASLLSTDYVDLAAANERLTGIVGVDEVNRHTIVTGAFWSLLLTLANIVCIWISGILMFRVKEVAPLSDKTDFWAKHVPETRYYHNVIRKHDPEATELRKEVRRQLEEEHHRHHWESDGRTLQIFEAQQHHYSSKKRNNANILDEEFFHSPQHSFDDNDAPLTRMPTKRRLLHLFDTHGRSKSNIHEVKGNSAQQLVFDSPPVRPRSMSPRTYANFLAGTSNDSQENIRANAKTMAPNFGSKRSSHPAARSSSNVSRSSANSGGSKRQSKK